MLTLNNNVRSKKGKSMNFKKTALVSFTTLFFITGCMTTDNTESEKKQSTNESKQKIAVVSEESNSKAVDSKETSAKIELNLLKEQLKTEKQKEAKLKKQLNEKSNKQLNEKSNKKIQDKTILGQEEWAYVTAVKGNFKARIDSGAATSSINAVDIERFERDGKKWVRFNLTHNKDGKAQMIEAKIVRIAKITQSSKPGVETERPVVKLHIRMGDISTYSEFSLTNRLHMEYPVLIGRTFLQDIAVVDVSTSFIHPKYNAKNSK